MRLFTTISIEIGAYCNRKCWFCPNSINERPKEFMSKALIKKILRELGAIGYDKRIELYIYNEPLLDKRLEEIIALCRVMVPKSSIMFATNGDLIKDLQQINKWFKVGLNQLQVNVYSNVKRFKKLGKLLKKSNAIPGNVYENTSASKRVYSIEQKFDRKLTPTSPKIGRFELTNRSGNIDLIPKLPQPIQKICVRPFRLMQVNWEGKVIICCNDYHGEVLCGDVNKTSVIDIWEKSTTYRKYRNKLLKDDRSKLPLCDVCSFKGGAYTYLIKKQWK